MGSLKTAPSPPYRKQPSGLGNAPYRSLNVDAPRRNDRRVLDHPASSPIVQVCRNGNASLICLSGHNPPLLYHRLLTLGDGMTDFDKLERLIRIRDSGRLTEEEFLTEKAKLLAVAQPSMSEAPPTAARNWWLSGGVIVTVLAISVAAVIAVQRPSDSASQDTMMGENVAAPANDHTIAGATDTAGTSSPMTLAEGSYAWATSIFRVGENPAYIEKILGPPRQKAHNSLFYNLRGCPVSYLIKGTKVTGIEIAILDECTPDIKGQAITPQTEFSSIYSNFGFLQTSCLTLCGNKADPTVEYVVPGPHSDNFIGVSYSTNDAEEGVTVWRNEIAKAKGVASYFDVPSDGFYCPPKPSQVVVNAMKSAKIGSVTMGNDVEKCKEW